MRLLLAILAVSLLSACHERRSFDDRYNSTANEIEQRAAALDNQASGNRSAAPVNSSE